MRRKDREIKSFHEIVDVLRRCDTIRIGIQGEKYPYVVPVSFGVAQENNKVIVYFHCAKQGCKIDLIEKNPDVCIEGDIFVKTESTLHGITTRYESVIGFGTAIKMEGNEAVKGLKSIVEHYGYADYPIEECKGVSVAAVYKICLNEISGKRNLAEGS